MRQGWYEIRKADGQILTGGENGAKSAVLVSLTFRIVDEALPSQHGWCYTLGKDRSSFVKRYAVLDPYRQVTPSMSRSHQLDLRDPRAIHSDENVADYLHIRQRGPCSIMSGPNI